MNIDVAIQQAMQNIKEGKLQTAEHIIRDILKGAPDNLDALKLLGLISYQQKNYDAAVESLKKVTCFSPNDAYSYYIIGNALKENNKPEEAIIFYEKAITFNPNLTEALNNLGLSYQKMGKLDEAIVYYQKALQITPNLSDIYYNLGTVFQDKKQFDTAINYYQKALHFNPNDPDVYFNLGNIYKDSLDFDHALIYYQRALNYNPTLSDAYNNMGTIFHDKGQLEEAITCFKQALQINPEFVDAYNNIGLIYKLRGQFAEAIENFQHALKLNPLFLKAINNQAGVYIELGKITEAKITLKRALYTDSDPPAIYSSYLCVLLYDTTHDAQEVFTQHLRFGEQIAKSIRPLKSYTHSVGASSKKIKIGYVSPDFRKHSVAYFIEPVIASHTKQQFEVYCYSDTAEPDTVTQRIQKNSDYWYNIAGISDEELAQLVYGNKIDILVDLAGHTAGNRLPMFALKPAPIQISWIGYPATTGLKTMDYKIVDSYTDPPGMTEQYYVEKLFRMPETFLCYKPYEESPHIYPLPSIKSKHTTFCSFNIYAKISSMILTLWIQILERIPNAHLLLKAKCFADKTARQNLISKFKKEGIEQERIELLPFSSSSLEHFNLYNSADIALDTFPYNGTTTTCEAMWMGVPVITLAGNSHVSRVGCSLISNVGLTECIARTPQEYVDIAVSLSQDIDKMASIRKNLRDMMMRSALTDAKRFTLNLEKSFREMWKSWCITSHA